MKNKLFSVGQVLCEAQQHYSAVRQNRAPLINCFCTANDGARKMWATGEKSDNTVLNAPRAARTVARDTESGTVYYVQLDPVAESRDAEVDLGTGPRDRLNEAVSACVPNYIETPGATLTPAQLFYKTNRETLLDKANHYYQRRKANAVRRQQAPQAYWMWDSEENPVVCPPKGHVWETRLGGPKKKVHPEVRLEMGRLPSLAEIVTLLEQERISNCHIVNHEEYGRRDEAMYSIIGTAESTSRCNAAVEKLEGVISKLQIPFVSRASRSVKASLEMGPETGWAIGRFGPYAVHVLTQNSREKYRLQELIESQKVHYPADGFPTYPGGAVGDVHEASRWDNPPEI